MREAYSQDGEDLVLHSFIACDRNCDYKGFYVDIGAHHPERFSNTNIYYKMGWRGINIDGTPGSMNEFEKLRPDDINIETIVSNDNTEVIYYLFDEPALNSFDLKSTEEFIKAGYKLKEKIKVTPQTINDILDKNLPTGQKIDFINIDVEGCDFKILQTLDFEKYAPNYFIIEDCDYRNQDFMNFKEQSQTYDFLHKKGYIVVGKTMRSIIFKSSQ